MSRINISLLGGKGFVPLAEAVFAFAGALVRFVDTLLAPMATETAEVVNLHSDRIVA